MTNITLQELGLDRDQLAERLVDRMAEQMLSGVTYDEDGEEVHIDSRVARDLETMVQQKLSETIDQIANQHVLPLVTSMVEGAVLQETNKWGEARGEPVTFREYLVQRAEHWMSEPVSYDGKSKSEARDSFNWRATGTRIERLIHDHLQYEISQAMKAALANANSTIVDGLQKAVNIKLQEIKVALDVKVK